MYTFVPVTEKSYRPICKKRIADLYKYSGSKQNKLEDISIKTSKKIIQPRKIILQKKEKKPLTQKNDKEDHNEEGNEEDNEDDNEDDDEDDNEDDNEDDDEDDNENDNEDDNDVENEEGVKEVDIIF